MDNRRFRFVLASHGEQAKGMLNTVQMLLGQQENIVAYGLCPEQPTTTLLEQLEGEIAAHGAENIIFVTELMHGSPFNVVVSLTRDHPIFHITGINLAMLMAALMERDDEQATGETICQAAMDAAAGSFADVRLLLKESEADEEEEDL